MKELYRLLQRNGKGDLDSKKVLELKQIADKDFPDTDLQRGVEIIQSSYKPKLSKWFIEAWEIDNVGVERSGATLNDQRGVAEWNRFELLTSRGKRNFRH